MSEVDTNNLKKNMINYSIKISISIIIILVFYLISKIIHNQLIKEMEKSGKKKIAYELFVKILDKVILITGILIALVNLGFQLNTLLVILGSLGLAIALAIQGITGQFASGIIILFMNYFDINDIIQVNDSIGYVKDFNFLNTTINTPGKIEIKIPNNLITSSFFTNITKNETINCMIDLSLSANNSIDYSILISNIKNGIKYESKYIYDKENINVYITDFASSGTKLSIRFPIKSIDFFSAQFDARIIIRSILSKDSIVLLDNSYVSGSSSYS